ncbi:Holliday junction branch migration DNA helicase RuvB [Streptobacillus moniliformis]|uniref:Holliday junction branch migration DNA helicase RuvB n=1 Tax=Streptobacillus moniliformis TaxID=34105 RepID=UPI000A63CF90|nr:Holliday junction branch migration DNA helicase RuvB [Streptobacillus moniliformis]
MENRFVDLNEMLEDYEISNEINSLRPQLFKDYIGQEDLKETLSISIKAAKIRQEALDHILLFGPPGLGKTTMATVIANEMGTNIKITSGPVLEKAGDLVSILTTLEDRDVLFIDEIHRLSTNIEEILYSAMEDFKVDIMLGKGHGATSYRVELKRFTLIGATTMAGKLSKPFKDRFGIQHRMNFYTTEELMKIISRSANILGVECRENSLKDIALRSRGTPRLANRVLKRSRDYATVNGNGIINDEIMKEVIRILKVDDRGLDEMDRSLLRSIIINYSGGPVGVETLATHLGEDRKTIEEVYEPYLIQLGLLKISLRGREVTDLAYTHMGLEKR